MNRSFHAWIPALVVALAVSVGAQEPAPGPATPSQAQPPAAGWTLRPSLVYSGSWDDNVLIRGRGDQTTGDVLNVVNPRTDLEFNGRRGQFSLGYDGAFLLYRDLNGLDAYDQHASLFARRLLSRHVALFVRDSAAFVQTTDLLEFVGVPFERTGSKLNDTHAGIEATLSKRTSLVASYHLQWVQFDPSVAVANLLGGYSNGGTVVLHHLLSKRTTFTTDYDLQHAQVGPSRDVFDVQNATVGLDRQVSDGFHLFGAAGVSHLNVTSFGPARTGPSWRAGLTREFGSSGLDVLYSRSFVPSYGFGGTMQNEEVSTRLRLALSRRIYTRPSLAWRRNEPLTEGELALSSWWAEATVGYIIRPRVQIEAFYAVIHQTIDQPGGVLNRNRVGFQIITTAPMRVR